MNISIKELPKNERPRERLIKNGVENLSNEELLSIILKTGTKDMSAKVLATFLLKEIGSLKNLKQITYSKLIEIKGIGQAKACLLLALVELSKRINNIHDSLNDIKFTTPQLVYEYYKNKININQEEFYAIYLDSSKKILDEKKLFIGTVNYSLVHPRDVFKKAYELNATAIICVHNHPSGDVKPSKEDINVTNRLKHIGELMGIKIIDHIIIGTKKYYSFLENGKI